MGSAGPWTRVRAKSWKQVNCHLGKPTAVISENLLRNKIYLWTEHTRTQLTSLLRMAKYSWCSWMEAGSDPLGSENLAMAIWTELTPPAPSSRPRSVALWGKVAQKVTLSPKKNIRQSITDGMMTANFDSVDIYRSLTAGAVSLVHWTTLGRTATNCDVSVLFALPKKCRPFDWKSIKSYWCSYDSFDLFEVARRVDLTTLLWYSGADWH